MRLSLLCPLDGRYSVVLASPEGKKSDLTATLSERRADPTGYTARRIAATQRRGPVAAVSSSLQTRGGNLWRTKTEDCVASI